MMSLFKKDRVREQYAAPSFSLKAGTFYSISSPKALRELLMKECYTVLIYPDGTVSDLNSWARALSYSAYAVIPDCSEAARKLYKAVDRIVFSPVPKRISGAYLAKSEIDAEKLLSSESIAGSVITVNII